MNFTRSKSGWHSGGLFFLCVALLLASSQSLQATDGTILGPGAGPKPDYGWPGIIQLPVNNETAIYVVQVIDGAGFPLFNTVSLGWALGIPGINIKIRDLTGGTGLQIADFTGLNIYRSTDATLDSGDGAALNSVANGGPGPIPVAAVGIGPALAGVDNTTLNVLTAPALLRLIPSTPGGIYFIITAIISPTATPGHAFTIQVDPVHVGFDEIIAPGDEGLPFGMVFNDARHIVIAAQTAMFSGGDGTGGRTIPFGGEGAILVLLVGSGLYMIRRRTR